MFRSNFSSQIRSSLKIKQQRIDGYGGRGEFFKNGWMTKIYSILPSSREQYVRICSLRIEWSPTVSHLLDDVHISVRLSDPRGSTDQWKNREMMLIRKDASSRWVADVKIGLSVPICEARKGLPLSFDVTLHNAFIKEDYEIGELSFIIGMLNEKFSCESVIGPISFKELGEKSEEKELVLWKGMSKNSICGSNLSSASLVGSYLKGDISMNVLSEKIGDIARNITK